MELCKSALDKPYSSYHAYLRSMLSGWESKERERERERERGGEGGREGEKEGEGGRAKRKHFE